MTEALLHTESRTRSIMKALSWRIIAILGTVIISYSITHRISYAISIGSVELVVKTLLYYGHERAWSFISKG